MRRVRFTLADDSAEYEGWTDGSRWNGWLNVSVSTDVRDQIVSDLEVRACRGGFNREDVVDGIDTLPEQDGLVSLARGYCAIEVPYQRLTLAEAGSRLGVAPATLRRQVNAGRLNGRLVGKTWTVGEDEVERYREEHLGKVGRPPSRRPASI
jgi:Helix-turn-helix domain